ncbi:MAG: NDP-sugar synthase [Flavobacteriales bacterium]|jgi:NDP-sugar pyrophosphorylase family protein|nr:NDP-sugar synthase [Flavobacteriales bacterium]|tara:strand:+ start:286 stop:933 length:648 start_codon:yes stop_codon:yes gene_type:complete
MDAVIIAGGKGNRMEGDFPKALTIVKGKPIVARQIDYLLKSGIKKIILALGYKADEVIKYVKLNYPSAPLDYTIEEKLLGTAGGLKLALQKSESDYVVVLNCDDLVDIDLLKLQEKKENKICVAHPVLQFGRIHEKDGYAIFEERPLLDDWVSCGWYLFNREEILNYLPDKGMLEFDVFPKIKLRVYKHEGFWKTVNTRKDVIEFEEAELPDILK